MDGLFAVGEVRKVSNPRTPEPPNPRTPEPPNPRTPEPPNPRTPEPPNPRNPETPKPRNPETPFLLLTPAQLHMLPAKVHLFSCKR
jgi:hypothetical protein